jgi:hypothetical protein
MDFSIAFRERNWNQAIADYRIVQNRLFCLMPGEPIVRRKGGSERAEFMSWRFRKTFKVFPGVKLNLTPHGLSATIGAAPFSLNVGPRGVYGNVDIPGTGIWARERLDTPSMQRPAIEPTPSSTPDSLALPGGGPPPSPSPVMEIRSQHRIAR